MEVNSGNETESGSEKMDPLLKVTSAKSTSREREMTLAMWKEKTALIGHVFVSIVRATYLYRMLNSMTYMSIS